jgi:hypothetical protein
MNYVGDVGETEFLIFIREEKDIGGKDINCTGRKCPAINKRKDFDSIVVITAWRYQDCCYFQQLFSFMCVKLDVQDLRFFSYNFQLPSTSAGK